MTLLGSAVALGERGFRVHPLKAKDQPYTKYSQTASSDSSDIERLWRQFPDALIGICTGAGLVVLDDDRGRGLPGGLAAPDTSLPVTLTATTPSGGFHSYYYCTTPVRNSTSKVAPGIDIRGEGGYVVAPPSEGRTWYCDDGRLETLPGVLLAACMKAEPKGGDFEPRQHVPAGERHDYLVRFAGWALSNELAEAEDSLGLFDEVYEHALQVCAPWPRSELVNVRNHIRQICAWVIARESGER